MSKNIIITVLLIFLTGCTPAVFSHHELLPNNAYINREPIEIKSIYDRKRAGEVTAKERAKQRLVTQEAIDKEKITVYKDGLKPKLEAIYFAQIAAWSQAGTPTELLNKKLIDEAKKLGAEIVVLLDKGSEISGQSTIFSNDIGFAITQNRYITYRKAIAGMKSKAFAGFITDQNGIIKYITKNSAAEKSGLKEGFKILSVNGTYFLQDPYVGDREIRIKSPGDIITLEILDRAGEKQSASLILASPAD